MKRHAIKGSEGYHRFHHLRDCEGVAESHVEVEISAVRADGIEVGAPHGLRHRVIASAPASAESGDPFLRALVVRASGRS